MSPHWFFSVAHKHQDLCCVLRTPDQRTEPLQRAAHLAPKQQGRGKSRTSTLGEAEVARYHPTSFKHKGNVGMGIFCMATLWTLDLEGWITWNWFIIDNKALPYRPFQKSPPSIPQEGQREGKERTENSDGSHKSPLETEKGWWKSYGKITFPILPASRSPTLISLCDTTALSKEIGDGWQIQGRDHKLFQIEGTNVSSYSFSCAFLMSPLENGLISLQRVSSPKSLPCTSSDQIPSSSPKTNTNNF